MKSQDAFDKSDLNPIILGPKEGLALINGTQVSTAFALAGLFKTWRIACGHHRSWRREER